MLHCKPWQPEKPRQILAFSDSQNLWDSALQPFICPHQHHLAVSFTHVLQILTTVFTLSAWTQRACGLLPSKLIPPHLQPWRQSWGLLLPHLSSWYKGLPLSLYLRPNFRKSVCERGVQRGKKTTHRGKVYLIILGVFFFLFSICSQTPFLWCGLLGADSPGLKNLDLVFLLKAMVAYDELGSLVPIKRTLQVIDYQNQANKESEVRCEISAACVFSANVCPQVTEMKSYLFIRLWVNQSQTLFFYLGHTVLVCDHVWTLCLVAKHNAWDTD